MMTALRQRFLDNRTLIRDLLRGVIAALVIVPGVSKFLTYDNSVAFFTSLGLPEPELLVLMVGVIELAAAGLLLIDRYIRIAALVLVPVMGVAIATAGPALQNVGVLVTSLVLVGLESWAVRLVDRQTGKAPSTTGEG